MKKGLAFVLVLTMFCLAGCAKNEEENKPAEPSKQEEVTVKTDAEVLEDLKNKIHVVENRQDFNDESGELLYYVQKDYLTTSENDEALQKIVAHYPQPEITPMEDAVSRIYPDDVYYDTTTYSLFNVHNGILTIATQGDWWWGSPHGYPTSSFENYVIKTGEIYDFPADIKDEVYQKAVDEFMKMAAEYHYNGLMGDYYDEESNRIIYLTYENETYSLTDEQALRDLVEKELRGGSFYMKDDKIYFSMEAAYILSDWASRGAYSKVVIPNEWEI